MGDLGVACRILQQVCSVLQHGRVVDAEECGMVRVQYLARVLLGWRMQGVVVHPLIQNASSGFLVFLIALPLCLGIALASGFPPVAGVLTAIVGGLVCTHLGSAELTIKGPAAGLIVIALGAVQELGGGDPVLGYRRALAVGVLAAVVQIGFAIFRSGRFASIMPPAVVHGMLAAIGVIIIAKQLPIVLGVVGAHGEPLEMLLEVPHYLVQENPEVMLIGAVAILTLAMFPLSPWKPLKRIPAPLAVLLITVPMAVYFNFSNEHGYDIGTHHYTVGPAYLVQLPGSLLSAITFPDFSMVFSFASMKYVVMFALVGTVESLLSVIAVDAMDPEHRTSNLDRDLLVTGFGNLLAASIGGLPMISEIVRSKANIDAGATSRWSNFFHGAFLLMFVALVPGLLKMIPLAALAAMLVVTGARLASPNEFLHVWHIGKDQFALFLTTFIVTLTTDLLLGVAAGILLKLALHMWRVGDLRSLFQVPATLHVEGTTLHVEVHGPLAFTNLLRLTGQIDKARTEAIRVVRIDFANASLVDHTTQQRLRASAQEWPNTELELVGLEGLLAISPHPHSLRTGVA